MPLNALSRNIKIKMTCLLTPCNNQLALCSFCNWMYNHMKLFNNNFTNYYVASIWKMCCHSLIRLHQINEVQSYSYSILKHTGQQYSKDFYSTQLDNVIVAKYNDARPSAWSGLAAKLNICFSKFHWLLIVLNTFNWSGDLNLADKIPSGICRRFKR